MVWLEGGLDYVRGDLTALDKPLPRMPPLRGRAGLRFQKNAFQAGVDGVFTAKQDRIFTVDTPDGPVGETPTDGYNLLKLFASYSFVSGEGDQHDHRAARQRDRHAVPQPPELPEGSGARDGPELPRRLQREVLGSEVRATAGS